MLQARRFIPVRPPHPIDHVISSSNLAILAAMALLANSLYGPLRTRRFSAILAWGPASIYFLLGTQHYLEIEDYILLIMAWITAPLAAYLMFWEWKSIEHDASLTWLRGALLWSTLPWFLISNSPILSVILIQFTAEQTAWMSSITGTDSLITGGVWVDPASGPIVRWDEWEGNRWWLQEELGYAGFHVPMLNSVTGETVHVNIILGCTALQSMIVFVGAIIAVRDAPLRRRIRALLATIPVIHVLNIFRNCGIIHLSIHHRSFEFFGMGAFDFAHDYASKILSLGAMFLMALGLFELIPKMHVHVLRILDSIRDAIDGKRPWTEHQSTD